MDQGRGRGVVVRGSRQRALPLGERKVSIDQTGSDLETRSTFDPEATPPTPYPPPCSPCLVLSLCIQKMRTSLAHLSLRTVEKRSDKKALEKIREGKHCTLILSAMKCCRRTRPLARCNHTRHLPLATCHAACIISHSATTTITTSSSSFSSSPAAPAPAADHSKLITAKGQWQCCREQQSGCTVAGAGKYSQRREKRGGG